MILPFFGIVYAENTGYSNKLEGVSYLLERPFSLNNPGEFYVTP
jgi:hypothetical protein